VSGTPLGLGDLAALARGVDEEAIAAQAEALLDRVAAGHYYVTVLGQLKRGKSTLVNALCGYPVLPVGVAPVTSVVTVVRHGDRTGARVRIRGVWRDIDPSAVADYITEERNPRNAKAVEVAEVLVPSTLLATGMCLVDTPGVGSIFAGATASTRAFVPHIDAALVVLGADPPITGDELALVEEVAAHTDRLLLVLAKADRLSDIERHEAGRFNRRVLAEALGRPVDLVFEVSIADGHGARDFSALVRGLEQLASRAGSQLVRAAERRGMSYLAERLQRALEERHDALLRPIAESERRIELCRRAVEDAERSLLSLRPLLRAEDESISARLGEDRDRALARLLPAASMALSAALAGAVGPRLRRGAMEEAQRIARAALEGWREEEQPVGETIYREAADRFVALGNQFLARLAAVPELSRLPKALPPESGLRGKSKLYYTELLPVAQPGLGKALLDLVLPHGRRARAIERDARAYLHRLLETNTARIVNDLRARVADSRQRLESELAALLRGARESAERGLARAREARARGDDEVRVELRRIDEAASALLGHTTPEAAEETKR
jgi:hypothetical protein